MLLKPLITSPLIEVGEFSYYDDPAAFEARNVLYHVWLGYQAMVMRGVRIGHGAVIASGSVVVDDLENALPRR